MTKRLFGIISPLLLAGIACTAPAMTHSSTFQAGTAKVDITPPDADAVDLLGHNLKVIDRLFARALVLQDGDTSLAIVSLDLILFASRKVVEQAKAKWNVDHVILCSTHTHAGMSPQGLLLTPHTASDWTRKSDDPGNTMDWDALSDDPWYAATEAKIVAVIGEACRNRFPARIAAGTEPFESAYMAHNRRLVNEDGSVTAMWDNPKRLPTEPIDPTIRVIRIDDLTGKTRALLVNYACHPVAMANTGYLSRDFPGAMVDYVEKELGPDCMAMFLQGAQGDLDPYDMRLTGEHLFNIVRQTGLSLGKGALRLAKTLQPPVSGNTSLKVKQSILSIAHRHDPEKLTGVAMTTAVINDTIALTSIPGEPFVQHQLDLAKASPVHNTLLLGLAYSGQGSPFLVYIPTEQAVKEGGYGATEASYVATDAGKQMVDEAVKSIHELTGK